MAIIQSPDNPLRSAHSSPPKSQNVAGFQKALDSKNVPPPSNQPSSSSAKNQKLGAKPELENYPRSGKSIGADKHADVLPDELKPISPGGGSTFQDLMDIDNAPPNRLPHSSEVNRLQATVKPYLSLAHRRLLNAVTVSLRRPCPPAVTHWLVTSLELFRWVEIPRCKKTLVKFNCEQAS